MGLEDKVHSRRVFQKPKRLERRGKSRRIAELPQEGKFQTHTSGWVLLEKDLDFVIISDAIRRRF